MSAPPPETSGDPHRHSRAPPPTPIATGKGTRTAAVDDRVLAEFLETLKVPDLTMPDPVFPSRHNQRVPAEVDLPSLIARDAAAVRRMLASAAVVGAFRVDGRGVVTVEEVRSVAEAGRAGFRIPEARREELGECFGRREGIGEELYWDWRRSSETEKLLEKVWPGTYRIFREKMESLASKLEMIAQCLQRNVSKHVKNQKQSHGSRRIRSVLCLRKYDPQYFAGEGSDPVDAKHLQYPAIILHLYGDDNRFCIPCPEGYVSSTSILVTVDGQLQEWCNDAFTNPCEEIFFETTCASVSSRSVGSISSSAAQSNGKRDSIKTITITDQLFIMLTLSFLYKLCECIYIKFA